MSVFVPTCCAMFRTRLVFPIDGRAATIPEAILAHGGEATRSREAFAALPAEVLRNRALLEAAMARRGFIGLPTEWWHFDLRGWERYPVLDVPLK